MPTANDHPIPPKRPRGRPRKTNATPAPTAELPATMELPQPADLPKGWRWEILGSIAKTSSGGTPNRGVPTYFGGNIPWVKSGELRDGVVYEVEEFITEEGLKNSSAKMFPKGTVCIAMYGATVGKIGILGMDATTNQAVCGILLPDNVNRSYLYWYLFLKRSYFINQGKGGAQPNINQEIIRNLPLPLPPLPEQKKIVAKIEELFSDLDAGVANLKKVQANLKRYRAAVLKAACEGKLVPTEAELQKAAGKNGKNFETGEQLLQRILAARHKSWAGRGKYKEQENPDTNNLPALPEGWTWATVDQVSSVGTGATPNRGNNRYWSNGDIPWITSSAVNSMFVESCTEYVTKAALEETNLTIYPKHTLILAMYGEGKTRGMVSELLLDATTNQALAAIEMVGCSDSCRKYLKTFLQGHYEDMRRLASGGVQPNLNLSLVRQISFPLPSLAEQERIVADVERRLSVIDELETTVTANLKRAEHLRQTILKKAFEGGLV
jgi:type I restriction enzyme S subunit